MKNTRSSHPHSGFPVPSEAVAYGSTLSNTAHVSSWTVPDFSNAVLSEVQSLETRIRTSQDAVGMLVSTEQGFPPVVIGTATLVSPNQALVAKHCVEGWNPKKVYVFMEDPTGRQAYYPLVNGTSDSRMDAALLTFAGQPGRDFHHLQIESEAQPRGKYYLIHYAGGNQRLISTGEVVDFGDSSLHQVQSSSAQGMRHSHRLLIDAGPLASGGAVVNDQGKAIGINIERTSTDKFGKAARNVLLFAETGLASRVGRGRAAEFQPFQPNQAKQRPRGMAREMILAPSFQYFLEQNALENREGKKAPEPSHSLPQGARDAARDMRANGPRGYQEFGNNEGKLPKLGHGERYVEAPVNIGTANGAGQYRLVGKVDNKDKVVGTYYSETHYGTGADAGKGPNFWAIGATHGKTHNR